MAPGCCATRPLDAAATAPTNSVLVMATFRVFFRGDLGADATSALRRNGASVYSGFVDLTASSEGDARSKFSAATRGRCDARATAIRAT
jgi:hypothetical protein